MVHYLVSYSVRCMVCIGQCEIVRVLPAREAAFLRANGRWVLGAVSNLADWPGAPVVDFP